MNKKMMSVAIVLMGVVIGGSSCAKVQEPVVSEVLPIEVTVANVEKVFLGKESMALKLNLELYNPNDVLVHVPTASYMMFVNVDDEEINLLCGQCLDVYIPGKTSVRVWSTSAVSFAGMVGVYLMKLLGGSMEEYIAGVGALFGAIGEDKVVYKVQGDIVTTLLDHPELGSELSSFSLEWAP